MSNFLVAGRISAVLGALTLGMFATRAEGAAVPIVMYDAAVSGSGDVDTVILDQSGQGNDGTVVFAAVSTSTDVPSGLTGMSYDLRGHIGGINTNAIDLLNNTDVVAAGGLTLETWIKTDLTTTGRSGSIIDYAGTERIQLAGQPVSGSLADPSRVEARFANAFYSLPNQEIDTADGDWHFVQSQFILTDASDPAHLRGELRLTVDDSTLIMQGAGKTDFGDTLDRSIGVGRHPGGEFNNDVYGGLIYNPTVSLGVDLDPELPAIRVVVNQATGAVTFRNAGPALEIAGYSLLSSQGALNDAAWQSIASGNSDWSVFAESADELGEASLDVQMFGAGQTMSLGNVWTPSSSFDISAEFLLADDTVINGFIEYVDDDSLSGDYNNDGKVDAADYTVWRDNVGAPAGTLPNDIDGGVIGQAQYNTWKTNFGMSGSGSGGTGTVAAVPEPASFLLLAVGIASLAGFRRRALAGLCPTVVALLALGTSPALAAFTLDRDYTLGDNDNDDGTPTAGAAVGSTTSTNDTFDDAGMPGTGTFQDLTPIGTVVYEDVSSRPLAGDSQLGVRFDGFGGHLSGLRFGFPANTASSIAAGGPLDYSGLSDRGMQFWVNPDADVLGNGFVQSVVLDTNQHGVLISGAGTWVMRYAGIDNEFDTGVSVASGWNHVMLVRPAGNPGGAQLYVNGEGIGFSNGDGNWRYSVGDETPLVVGANTDTFGDFFKGVIDDLELFVLGTSTDTLTDYGQFDLATDNKFIADALAGRTPGDLTDDGMVMGDGSGGPNDDVAVFISNWRAENVVNGSTVGGLNTYDLGDFSMDGLVDFHDWAILRANHVDGASLNLGALLRAAQVPEPGSLLLAGLACMGLLWAARRRG